jgi:hypothetical protein
MEKLVIEQPVRDRSPVGDTAMETTLLGTLFFEGDHPGVKTANGSVLLHMPDFFRYAYFEGIKPEAQVKVRGLVRQSIVKGEHSVIHAREVSIGSKTFHVVPSSPHHDCHLRSLESAVHPLCPYHMKSLGGAVHPDVLLS